MRFLLPLLFMINLAWADIEATDLKLLAAKDYAVSKQFVEKLKAASPITSENTVAEIVYWVAEVLSKQGRTKLERKRRSELRPDLMLAVAHSDLPIEARQRLIPILARLYVDADHTEAGGKAENYFADTLLFAIVRLATHYNTHSYEEFHREMVLNRGWEEKEETGFTEVKVHAKPAPVKALTEPALALSLLSLFKTPMHQSALLQLLSIVDYAVYPNPKLMPLFYERIYDDAEFAKRTVRTFRTEIKTLLSPVLRTNLISLLETNDEQKRAATAELLGRMFCSELITN